MIYTFFYARLITCTLRFFLSLVIMFYFFIFLKPNTNNNSPHVRDPRQSSILYAMPWIPDPRYWIPVFLVKLGFWIPIISRIPDSLSCIPDSKAQDSGFHKQNFYGFRDPDSLTWGETTYTLVP